MIEMRMMRIYFWVKDIQIYNMKKRLEICIFAAVLPARPVQEEQRDGTELPRKFLSSGVKPSPTEPPIPTRYSQANNDDDDYDDDDDDDDVDNDDDDDDNDDYCQ